MQLTQSGPRTIASFIVTLLLMSAGALAVAFSIEVFLIPNQLIDGGIIGIAMICSNLLGREWLPVMVVAFNIPFLYMAWRYIGKHLVINMLMAVVILAGAMVFIGRVMQWEFHGDPLEVVVIGGSILGFGLGTIIRVGGCLDGTEILGIIVNQRKGLTVGQVVLACNVIIFCTAGIVFQDWHPPLLSLITYIVAVKVMDAVIVGLDETKQVTIISKEADAVRKVLIHDMGLGLTVLNGRGGFTGADQDVLLVIAERLQLAQLKELVYSADPAAFVAIQNLHEVANGRMMDHKTGTRETMEKLVSKVLGGRHPK